MLELVVIVLLAVIVGMSICGLAYIRGLNNEKDTMYKAYEDYHEVILKELSGIKSDICELQENVELLRQDHVNLVDAHNEVVHTYNEIWDAIYENTDKIELIEKEYECNISNRMLYLESRYNRNEEFDELQS